MKTERQKKKKPFVRSQWQRLRVHHDFEGVEHVTKDSFEQTTSVHHILDRFQRTGILPTAEDPQYGEQQEATLQDIEFAKANIETSFNRLSPEEQAKHQNAFDWLNSLAEDLQQGQAEDVPPLDHGEDTPPVVPSSEPESEASEA